MDCITEKLLSLRDEKYKVFSSSLVPGVENARVIGVRVPDVRALAKSLDDGTAAVFMKELPHKYHEENLLHAALIEKIRDMEECVKQTDIFLPYVDNWAVCDCFNPKIFAKNKQELLKHINRWLSSKNTYTVRFGLKSFMKYYLDGDFKPEYLETAAKTDTKDYYLSMMTAWFFATALAKQYESAVPYIENRRLDTATHNRAIQKAVDSYRVPNDKKQYLKTLRIKENKNA